MTARRGPEGVLRHALWMPEGAHLGRVESRRWPGILKSGSKRRAQNGFLSLAIQRLC